MRAVDTNILIYAHREETPRHEAAAEVLTSLAEGRAPWGLPVFVLAEFVRVVTHARVFTPPSTLEEAHAFLDALFESPGVRLLLPDDGFWSQYRTTSLAGRATGNLAFDAQIAAVCETTGSVLVTADRDFSRFDTSVELLD